jgi:hypothetical protein
VTDYENRDNDAEPAAGDDTGFADGDVETIDSPGGGAALFDGDTGTLPENVRAVLLTLLKRPYVSGETKPAEYELILEHEPALRTRLNDQFLDLVVDREHKVAYKRQAVSETGDKYPTLLYDQAYNREETILLVTLRRMLSGSKADAVFVDRTDLLDAVTRHRPATATDTVGDAKATANAIENLLKSQLLLKTSQTDRYRVPTMLKALLDVRRLEQLLTWLQTANGTPPAGQQLSTDGVDSPDTGESGSADVTELVPQQALETPQEVAPETMEESA